jgi:membrane protease YdiL (CAAX protease family)
MIVKPELKNDEIKETQQVLGANNEYMQQTKEYGRTDALLALLLFIIEMLGLSFVGELFLQKGSALSETFIVSVTGIFSVINIGLVFLFCILRRQKLITIGFSKTQAYKSFILGVILFGFVAIFCSIKAIISGSAIQTDIKLIIIRIMYYLIFIAFMEELIFRAYIGTRLFGFFKNKRLSIVIVGTMFSFEHIPFYMIISQMSLTEYISTHFFNLIYLALIHILFQWLYSRNNSIIAPTILHFIWDYIQWIII